MTNHYARANLETKRLALAKTCKLDASRGGFSALWGKSSAVRSRSGTCVVQFP